MGGIKGPRSTATRCARLSVEKIPQAGSTNDKISAPSRSKLEGIGGGEAVESPSSRASSLSAGMVQPKRYDRMQLYTYRMSPHVCTPKQSGVHWHAWRASVLKPYIVPHQPVPCPPILVRQQSGPKRRVRASSVDRFVVLPPTYLPLTEAEAYSSVSKYRECGTYTIPVRW